MNALEASQIISDEYAVRILMATMRSPRSAIELSRKLDIPIAACYRRIRTLEEVGLIGCTERVLTQKGKRMSVYISKLRNAYIILEDGKLKVEFEMKSGKYEDFGGNLDLIDGIKI